MRTKWNILDVFIRMRNNNESNNDQVNGLQASFRAVEDEVPRLSGDCYYPVPFRHLLWKSRNKWARYIKY